jgi:hypothetical protein
MRHSRIRESEKAGLLKESEISLVIDTYDDIFSDFDPRPYSQRSLSQDFLDEAKRASRDKKYEKIHLKFLTPKNIRNTHDELMIKKRLREHFKKHALEMKKEHKKIIKEGAFFILLGFIFMTLTTFFLLKKETNVLFTFLSVFLEPGGWFLFWEGLYLIIFDSRREVPYLDFYKRMSAAEIVFKDY